MHLPVLYSFRRCPYAIRARMAIRYAGLNVELREVELKNKPDQMLAVSAKGTVPVLIDIDGSVIDESLDIMYWALNQNDTDHWLHSEKLPDAKELIDQNDSEFKYWLDRYKYHVGYPEHPQGYYRDRCEQFMGVLNGRMTSHAYLLGAQQTIADSAIFPFVRQCAFVDKPWFDALPYAPLQRWLDAALQSDLFVSVMEKYSPWSAEAVEPVVL